METFNVDFPVKLESVVDSAIVCAFDKKFDGKILFNKDMDTLADNFI